MSLTGMIDAVFDISGDRVPEDYPFTLWEALTRIAPALDECACGVLPLRTTGSQTGMLLPKRAKLVLRIPTTSSHLLDELSGQALDLDGNLLKLGSGKLRAIQAYPTIHAQLVPSAGDEVEFITHVRAYLTELDIQAGLICGIRTSLIGPVRTIHGYSLVIHDLKPEASLTLQYMGFGQDHRYGCGVFVPYKIITGLD